MSAGGTPTEAPGVRFEPSGLVTLTSDFGTVDGYVGAMKGVMLSVSPPLRLVDVAHDLPPQALGHAAATVAAAAPWFPVGTVHLVVVDPGVGTDRAALVVLAGGHCFVGPDNGVLMEAAEAVAAGGSIHGYRIEGHAGLPQHRSATFHGRDVFAPTAAGIAAATIAPADVGPPCTPERLATPRATVTDAGVAGEVVRADRFGNLITTIPGDLLRGRSYARCVIGTACAPLGRTYSDVEPGGLIALIGSGGQLEIAVRDGAAARLIPDAVGAQVLVR